MGSDPPPRAAAARDAAPRDRVVDGPHGRITVTLDIVPDDDDDPHALLAAQDAAGEKLARVRVSAGFRLSRASATAWIGSGYARPRA